MKLGVRNWIMVGIMAMLFIIVSKVVFTKFHVPHVSDLVLSV